jgi:DNA-binding CsgD family transcriptional regulator
MISLDNKIVLKLCEEFLKRYFPSELNTFYKISEKIGRVSPRKIFIKRQRKSIFDYSLGFAEEDICNSLPAVAMESIDLLVLSFSHIQTIMERGKVKPVNIAKILKKQRNLGKYPSLKNLLVEFFCSKDRIAQKIVKSETKEFLRQKEESSIFPLIKRDIEMLIEECGFASKEIDVTIEVCQGKCNKEIAEKLEITPHTVKKYINIIIHKMSPKLDIKRRSGILPAILTLRKNRK